MKKILTLFLLLFFFSSCEQAPPQNISDNNKTQEVVRVSNEDYKMMIPLLESSIRGISLPGDSDTFIDYDNMEEELLEITKEFLNTNELFYEPGQILDVDDANNLLKRESDENPRAINPKKTSSIEDSAYYINTIIEQDFYYYDEYNEKKIDTVAFGFGIDTTYEQDGKTITISDEKIKDFITKYVASKIDEYLKDQKGLEEVNIICAFYKESTDSTIPGSYYTYGMINKGEDKLEKVQEKNIEYKSYPDYSLDGDKINNAILSFTETISKYFENYTGVSAIAKYENGDIQKMNIDLIVDFFSRAEIEAFSSYVKDSLSSDMKKINSLEINIVLPSGEILGIIEYQNSKLIVDYIKK